MMKLKVGVLACQGAFSEHVSSLKDLDRLNSGKKFNLEIIEVRSAQDVTADLKGLIIPGGVNSIHSNSSYSKSKSSDKNCQRLHLHQNDHPHY